MLVEFSVQNYLSFKKLTTFSMVASNIRELKDTNTFDSSKGLNLLKSAAVYGANASGKSNLCKAMSYVAELISDSSKETQAEEEIDVYPFLLSTETENKPSCFEIVFIEDKTLYRYGFEVDRSEIISEWLFYTPKNKEYLLFEREGQHFDVTNHFPEGKDWTNKTRKNALLLSVIAQFNGEISTKIMKWVRKKFRIVSGLDNRYTEISKKMLQNADIKNLFMKFIKSADIGIMDVLVEKNEFSTGDMPKELVALLKNSKNKVKMIDTAVKTLHTKYDNEKKAMDLEKFDLDEHESAGTRKLFSILAPILDTLISGGILIVDELDSSLHPLITKTIIDLFNSNENNQCNSQLIFNTHDTNLLSNKVFRRDQIWFAEKDVYGATHMYSLVDYDIDNKVRKDAAYEKNYLMGKYGAIPYIGQFDFSRKDGNCCGE